MNKAFLKTSIQDKIEELNKKYRSYFDTDTGPSKSVSGAACMRSRYLKDINTLKLLLWLISKLPDGTTIPDEYVVTLERFIK